MQLAQGGRETGEVVNRKKAQADAKRLYQVSSLHSLSLYSTLRNFIQDINCALKTNSIDYTTYLLTFILYFWEESDFGDLSDIVKKIIRGAPQ